MPIVAAVMTAAASMDKPLAQKIEEAMAQAVTDALAEGISINDSDAIRERMMAAREGVKSGASSALLGG